MNLQTKLVSLRKQKGLTQLDLAEKLNVSRQAISRWEVGYSVPSTDNLKVLSELYGVSIDYLLNEGNDNRVANENLEQIEQKERSKRINYRGTVICAAAFVIAFLLTMICIFAGRGKENDQVIPIEDMETIGAEAYPTVTFSIG